MQNRTIGFDVFQVHGIDAAEKAVVWKRLRRGQVLEFLKTLPPYLIVKAYIKCNKNDAADAEAICEAVRLPTMRFVRMKSAEEQGRPHSNPAVRHPATPLCAIVIVDVYLARTRHPRTPKSLRTTD